MTVERIKQYIQNRLKYLNEADDEGARHELTILARLITNPEKSQPYESPEGENPRGPRYL